MCNDNILFFLLSVHCRNRDKQSNSSHFQVLSIAGVGGVCVWKCRPEPSLVWCGIWLCEPPGGQAVRTTDSQLSTSQVMLRGAGRGAGWPEPLRTKLPTLVKVRVACYDEENRFVSPLCTQLIKQKGEVFNPRCVFSSTVQPLHQTIVLPELNSFYKPSASRGRVLHLLPHLSRSLPCPYSFPTFVYFLLVSDLTSLFPPTKRTIHLFEWGSIVQHKKAEPLKDAGTNLSSNMSPEDCGAAANQFYFHLPLITQRKL